jgi:hypothetical protein
MAACQAQASMIVVAGQMMLANIEARPVISVRTIIELAQNVTPIANSFGIFILSFLIDCGMSE